MVRIVVNLDHNPIGTGSNAGTRHGNYLVPNPDSVRGIGNDRKVTLLLYDRDGPDIKGISRGRLKCPYPPLAENDILIPAGEDVFCRHEPFLNRGCEPPLEHHRL